MLDILVTHSLFECDVMCKRFLVFLIVCCFESLECENAGNTRSKNVCAVVEVSGLLLLFRLMLCAHSKHLACLSSRYDLAIAAKHAVVFATTKYEPICFHLSCAKSMHALTYARMFGPRVHEHSAKDF
jgi:hypothetical protein